MVNRNNAAVTDFIYSEFPLLLQQETKFQSLLHLAFACCHQYFDLKPVHPRNGSTGDNSICDSSQISSTRSFLCSSNKKRSFNLCSISHLLAATSTSILNRFTQEMAPPAITPYVTAR
ncbi:hypothetical protein DY000_02012699 [Brassica cretica]|uniref:Uncharacterized protein n=1 Tax=Brassica cretica TaxID=69181 RepID=A0ABQ7CWH0_BRACR|nr:hypothetical protein DY000_02012699 [Brassica cretica]